MSTIDELLDEQLEIEENPICVIDKLTRKINMHEECKFFGVQRDKRVERIKFECPKLVGDENVDLTTCSLFIAYENANGEPGLYEIKDVSAVGENINFSWLFDEDVTLYKGEVRFIFYATKHNLSTNETENAWNTTPAQGFVEEGLNAGTQIEGRYPSIIEAVISNSTEALKLATDANKMAREAKQIAEGFIQEARDAIGISTAAAQSAVNSANAANAAANDAANALNQVNEKADAVKADAEKVKNAESTVLNAVNDVTSAKDATVQAAADAENSKTEAINAANRAEAGAAKVEHIEKTANEANQKVDTLREVVSKFHSNIVEEASGDVITVSDASDMELAGLCIFGKTTQYTSTGKNLLDLSDAVDGYAILEDGTISAYSDLSYTKLIPLPVGTYTFSVDNKLLYSSTSRVHIYDAAGSWLRQAGVIREGHFVFEIAEGEYGVKVSFYTATNVQIESGNVATAFEPYTAGNLAPSPEYPMSLNSIGDSGSVNVNIENTNRFGGATLADWLVKQASAKKDEAARTVSYTAPSMSGVSTSSVFRFKENTRYTLIFKYTATSDTLNMRVYYADGGYDILRPGKTSTFTTWVFVTDENKTVSRLSGSYNSGTTVLKYDECGIFEGVLTAEDFEPYNRQTLTIQKPTDVPVFLPGIPVTSGGNYTNENGQQWICDEVDFAKGVYVQRIGTKQFDGSESWGYTGAYFSTFHDTLGSNSSYLGLCSHFNDDSFFVGPGGFGFYHTSQSVEDWKAWLAENNPTLIFALAKYIETPLSAEELVQYAALHTNYPDTTIFNDAGADMEVKYVADTKLYVDKKFEQLTRAILNNA